MTGLDLKSERAELRRSLLQARQSLPMKEWQEKSVSICTHLKSSPLFTQAQTVLAYFSFRQEPQLSSLFTETRPRWGFPRCVGKSLSWHSWKPGEKLQVGNFGIFEPCHDAPILEPGVVDLILVPALACDQSKYRLGYGGGYYDRLLSLDAWASKPTIGIVFEFAYLPQLPIETWDKPLLSVCTEIGLRVRG